MKHLFNAPPSLAFFAAGNVRRCWGARKSQTRTVGVRALSSCGHQAARVRSLARGVVFEVEPHRLAKMPDHELWMAFFRDPDRNLLALMCEKRD
jgi:methylmalonyl-CoA/ethylmalonyl-CoA epimerase